MDKRTYYATSYDAGTWVPDERAMGAEEKLLAADMRTYLVCEPEEYVDDPRIVDFAKKVRPNFARFRGRPKRVGQYKFAWQNRSYVCAIQYTVVIE